MEINLDGILDGIKKYKINKKIVFPDIDDERILKAVKILLSDGENPVLVGKKRELERYKDILEKVEYYEIGEEIDNNFYAAKLLNDGKVDGFISGNISTTGETVISLIKNVGRKPGIKRISGYFLMQTKLGLFLIADCGIQANPNEEELAEIAYLSAESAINFGLVPRIAMLSFSTNGSAKHEMVTKVQKSTILARKLIEEKGLKNVFIEGELQLDSAINSKIAIKKDPKSKLKGRANILIFPDLNSGNIGYKLIQYFGESKAIGPIIQGLNKPGNDLSRGCSVEDILTTYYITKNQS